MDPTLQQGQLQSPQMPPQAPQQQPQMPPQAPQGQPPAPPQPPQNPNAQLPFGFDRAIPGQSLTSTPKNAPWENPPKFVRLNDACEFVFDQMMQEPRLHQLLMMFKAGIPLEAIAKLIIFAGFSKGFWTPDLGLLMSRPVMYMLGGIAARAGLNPKLTHIDRSGMKNLVNLKEIIMSSSNPVDPMEPTDTLKSTLKGLMSPEQ